MSMLTLSGWTQPSDALTEALGLHDAFTFDYSDYQSPEASFVGLGRFAEVEQVIGWSMGGQLALRAIVAGVLRPTRLILISTPYQFLRSDAVREAMDHLTFTTFRDNYARDPARTASRFHALVAKGDVKFKQVVEQLRHHPKVHNTQRWLPWFDDLGRASLHGLDLGKVPPTVIIHGTEDAIVPVAQAQMLAKALPQADLQQWPGVAHAPHLHDPQSLRALLNETRSVA